jgi:PIN domain nuclease of toxin-antitoxin system
VRILLDTNALIWWLRGDDKLGPAAKALIIDSGTEILVSMVSLWEITIKWRSRKIEFSGGAMLENLAVENIAPLPIASAHLVALESVEFHHKDPFDHMILAQAMAEKAAIMTSDRAMALYGIPCIQARR